MSRVMTARCRAPKPSVIPSAAARDLRTRAPRVDPSRNIDRTQQTTLIVKQHIRRFGRCYPEPQIFRVLRDRIGHSGRTPGPIPWPDDIVQDPIHREAKSAEEGHIAPIRRKVLKCADRGVELLMVGSGSIPKRKPPFTVSHVFPSQKADRRRTCAREDPFTLGTWYQTGGQEASRIAEEPEGARNQAPCRVLNIRSDSPWTDHGRIFPPKVSPTARPA